jgi:hypothetical protein
MHSPFQTSYDLANVTSAALGDALRALQQENREAPLRQISQDLDALGHRVGAGIGIVKLTARRRADGNITVGDVGWRDVHDVAVLLADLDHRVVVANVQGVKHCREPGDPVGKLYPPTPLGVITACESGSSTPPTPSPGGPKILFPGRDKEKGMGLGTQSCALQSPNV